MTDRKKRSKRSISRKLLAADERTVDDLDSALCLWSPTAYVGNIPLEDDGTIAAPPSLAPEDKWEPSVPSGTADRCMGTNWRGFRCTRLSRKGRDTCHRHTNR